LALADRFNFNSQKQKTPVPNDGIAGQRKFTPGPTKLGRNVMALIKAIASSLGKTVGIERHLNSRASILASI